MTIPDATSDGGNHPRPQLIRASWHDLSGAWDFARDDALEGRLGSVAFDRTIQVPFPPESPASGIHETGFLPCVWYRRHFGPEELREAGWDPTRRTLVHFGAVDQSATVWVNGQLVATHEGGQSPFTADVTEAMDPMGPNELVVRAVDSPHDVSVLRGKQDWREKPHSIWYHRTTGIWQPVWLECVPAVSIQRLSWRTDLPSATVELDVEVEGTLPPDAWIHVRLRHEGELLAAARVAALGRSAVALRMVIPRQLNGQQYEELLWRPGQPTLLDASIEILTADGDVTDAVASYVGMRSVAAGAEGLLLNDRPISVRAVLAQNYWPETHLAASPEMLRREVASILELGFNTARVHQKAEDPRFLYWADRLGLMVWAETASAYAFDARAMTNLVAEWSAIIRRDASHPSIVVWVPLNESWGVQHIAHDPRQQAFSRSIADLTRALDGTRPVISNDGWEHTASDIATVHDYEPDPAVIAARYGDHAAVARLLSGRGPAGRLMSVGAQAEGTAVMLTEFGGVSLVTGSHEEWGYSTAPDPEAFAERVTALLSAAAHASGIVGFCYTQLTDTGQETNGLLYADRSPKVDPDRIRAAVLGRS
ncbi:glycoside hydrolase family 2 protein [Microbacterium sp. RD1]|uniref:glycoside hydrolase family 2 protein n=1 Tax=Microbacterium sp. RD1 TaxID=3457313 RepID=UPI003FA5651E